MGDKCNCYRFSPRDSLSGAVAQIADYLSKHPGWNETELRAFVDDLISSAGVETFNGRSGNVTLNKDDVNNLLIANCYFAEADETIESINVLALYKLGIRIVFTQYSSEVGGYTLAYGIEYYPATDTATAYLFSSGRGGVGAVVSVNGKTGTVVLKASDILMNNGDSVEDAVSNAKAIANAAYSHNNPPPYPVNSVNSKTGSVMLKVVDISNGNSTDENAYIFIDESDDYPDVIASDSMKLGGQLPTYYAPAEEVSKLKDVISDAWTAGKNYAVGDYCISGNQLYKCKTAHTAGSSFNADYWDAVSVADQISENNVSIKRISDRITGIYSYAINSGTSKSIRISLAKGTTNIFYFGAFNLTVGILAAHFYCTGNEVKENSGFKFIDESAQKVKVNATVEGTNVTIPFNSQWLIGTLISNTELTFEYV